MSRKVTLVLERPYGKSWEEALAINLEALNHAIQEAPAAYTAPLCDTKSIIEGIKKELLGTRGYSRKKKETAKQSVDRQRAEFEKKNPGFSEYY